MIPSCSTPSGQAPICSRWIPALSSLFVALLPCSGITAQSDPAAGYPAKPVRIIVPFVAGGNIDLTARTIAPGRAEALGQQVVVDNRGGAGGRIGTTLAAKSAPDGYTLLLGADGTLVIQATFSDSVEYQPLRDFVYTVPISLMPGVAVVHPSLPARNVKELIALAKARPATILIASPGSGLAGHLSPGSRDTDGSEIGNFPS